MPVEKKEKKKSSQGLKEKVDLIYEILSAHEISLRDVEKRLNDMSSITKKIKGRMGL
jgi:hypothetical protein|tara:strand:- start:530 stop:700 length:171 start_codon:yes stop_codon:yes gene_type:complete